jgi:hypothetical protein
MSRVPSYNGYKIGSGPSAEIYFILCSRSSRKDTTTCGGGSERAKVWIKVCNVNSPEKDRGVYMVTI